MRVAVERLCMMLMIIWRLQYLVPCYELRTFGSYMLNMEYETAESYAFAFKASECIRSGVASYPSS